VQIETYRTNAITGKIMRQRDVERSKPENKDRIEDKESTAFDLFVVFSDHQTFS
jgi:hypothetical protein